MCRARLHARLLKQKHFWERRDLQFLAPRFYELVVISVAATFPAIHIESYRLEPMWRGLRLLCVVKFAPRLKEIRQASAGWEVLDAADLAQHLVVLWMIRRQLEALIVDGRVD